MTPEQKQQALELLRKQWAQKGKDWYNNLDDTRDQLAALGFYKIPHLERKDLIDQARKQNN